MKTRDSIRIVTQFLAFYLAAGVVLASVNAITGPRIIRNRALADAALADITAQQNSFKKLMGSAETFVKLGTWTIHDQTKDYFAAVVNNERIGYVILSCGKGFSSMIQVTVALDTGFTVQAIAVRAEAETPGLGQRTMEPDFARQFIGKSLPALTVTTAADSSRIQAVAAATISSRAVTEDAVRSAVKFLKSKAGSL
jgi:Na+-translocating ferredoxin:NAD+ oxidoreductase subunit G